MKTTIDFNLTTHMIHTALGMDDAQFDALAERLSEKAKAINTQQLSPGTTAKWLAESLSFSEILLLATKQIYTTIERINRRCEKEDKKGFKKYENLEDLISAISGENKKKSKKSKKDSKNQKNNSLSDFLEKLSKKEGPINFPGGTLNIVRADSPAEGLQTVLKMINKLKENAEDSSIEERIKKSAPTYEDLMNSVAPTNENKEPAVDLDTERAPESPEE